MHASDVSAPIDRLRHLMEGTIIQGIYAYMLHVRTV